MEEINGRDEEAKVAVDWDAVRNRMAELEKKSGADWMPSAAEQNRILRSRAKLLARPEGSASSTEEKENLFIIEFKLASERYGIEASFVREVLPLREITIVPGAPSFVIGIFNVRGQVLSIVDLKKFFGLRDVGLLTELNKVLLLHDKRLEFGILADTIIGTRNLPVSRIEAPPPTVSGVGAEYLRGVTSDHLIVLNAEVILADKNIIVDFKAGQKTINRKGE